ncbi:DUF6089 family protein [Flavobacterium eburneipallidum]|uniref:type IX secretion system protein PorG n=1 Tax=Flavobacterium eburneipallidum TaxID=3003263 RepID=UPI0022AC6AFE|nr:DUF6089 family protein [Flavobacterium eburneipallidum]
MNKLFNLFFVLSFCTINAQIHELGVFVGGSNYVGDVGETTYINPNDPAIGFLYKWNKSPRLSYRFSLAGAFITGHDANSDEPSREQRGYTFRKGISEASAGIEFNFFDFNLHDYKAKITPYVHSGLNYLRYRDFSVVPGENRGDKHVGSFAIPMTLGLKSNVLPHFILGIEVGARYTFTDNLDGSNPEDNRFTKFGNLNNNDWYVFSGVTLTYTFGDKPCYCAQ